MPFGEVMYRCNAHYCLSSVFRNRVAGLVITLALMQLFLFSFYLNGLHSQTVVASNSPVSGELQLQQDPMTTGQEQQQQQQQVVAAAPGLVVRDDIEPARRRSVGQDELMQQINPSISKAKDAAKKALDHLMTNKKPAMDLMAMAAKKLSSGPNNDTPMAKLGLNLLANALNNVKQAPAAAAVADKMDPAVIRSSTADPGADDDQNYNNIKNQYANLAQMGLQMLTSGLAINQPSAGKQSDPSSTGVMEMATQLMMQAAKLSSSSGKGSSGLDPQVAKMAMGFLRNAVASQKLDPKMMIGLASKMMQMQSAVDATSGMNILSQLMASNSAAAGLLASVAKPVTPEQSKTIHRNYVKITSKKLPGIKSKMSKPYSSGSSKVVVDIGFQYTMEQVDACHGSNATSLIMAISSMANMEERQAARDTWLKDLHQLAGDHRVDIVFVIGQSANVTLQRLVDKEAAKYHDLIQTNVQEPVENAVFKTLAGLAWIERHCGNADIQHILKMDDDVYISPSRMLKALKEASPTPTITGSLIDNMNPHTTSGN